MDTDKPIEQSGSNPERWKNFYFILYWLFLLIICPTVFVYCLENGMGGVGIFIFLVPAGIFINEPSIDASLYASRSTSLTHSFLMVPTSACSASTTCGRMSPPMSTSMMSSPTASSPLASHTRT